MTSLSTAHHGGFTGVLHQMQRIINHQLGILQWPAQTETKWSWLSLGHCTDQWKSSQWNPPPERPEECFSKAWFISPSCILKKKSFYIYFYGTRSFCSSCLEDDLKHAILVKAFFLEPKCVSVPLKIQSSPYVTDSFLMSVFTHSLCLKLIMPEESSRLRV